jgi:hypothetical protein
MEVKCVDGIRTNERIIVEFVWSKYKEIARGYRHCSAQPGYHHRHIVSSDENELQRTKMW